MKTLPTAFRHDGFEFTQLERNGQIAIFRKSKPAYHHYEVVIIQCEQERTFPNGLTTPAHERMPGNEEWGWHGWSCQDFDRAIAKFNSLRSAAIATLPEKQNAFQGHLRPKKRHTQFPAHPPTNTKLKGTLR
jgi:hypothetical protein